ncbi:MAG TPA: aminotransferase class V-fold PLP-dependent enzyme, partial [Terriglobia bacterium]|nr:aminotransferase class V-fold PLP-dependent enzyme [Terriglobia bacterium]
ILGALPGVAINGDASRRLPATANLRFDGVDGEALVIALDLAGVACSTGAACSSGSLEPSHVLAAIGLGRREVRSSVRFSLGPATTSQDVDFALEVVPAVVERLRSLSPRGKKADLVGAAKD